MTRYAVRVEPLTVLHIGTGQQADPMAYTIRDDTCLRFRPEQIISALPETERPRFHELLDGNDYRKIALFLHRFVTPDNALYTLPVSPSVASAFKNAPNRPDNQFLIHLIYRDPVDGTPILPGSSLKGAIRTAVLDDLASAISTKLLDKGHEHQLLHNKGAQNDPFRALRIADCRITGTRSQAIMRFVNFKEKRKNGPDFSKMQIFAEIITGTLAEGDAAGWCTIELDESLLEAKHKQQPFFPRKLALHAIISACNAYYLENLEREIEKFYRHSTHRELQHMGEQLHRLAETILETENQCLVRVGRFSQVENVTYNPPHRRPRARKGSGNTRTITENHIPSGWVRLTFMREEEAREIRERERKKQEEIRQQQEKERKERERQEAEAKAEAERIANLPPHEKILLRINDLTEDPDTIAKVVRECLDADFPAGVYLTLKQKLEALHAWHPSGSKKRKQKIADRNRRIEEKMQNGTLET